MKKDRTSAQEESVLEKQRAAVSRCVKCGSCRPVCPSFLVDRAESFSARGRMALIQAVLDRKFPVSDVYADRLAACAGCLACEDVCAAGVPVTDVIQSAREEAVRQSGPGMLKTIIAAVLKNPALMRSTSWLAPLALHYRPGRAGDRGGTDARFTVQGSRRTPRRKKKTKVLFFTGCAISYYQPEIGAAAAAVLDRVGCEVVIPGGLQCCGRPLLSLGDRQAAEQVASLNAGIISAARADAVVTACASCSLTFKKEYPRLLSSGAHPPQVLDIHEFLSNRISHDIFSDSRMRKVTWHDPCHLGRGQGLAKEARDLVCAVPRLKLIEMEDPARCCGFGGVMRILNPGISDGIGDRKARDIAATQARTVVTGCPGCIMQIREGLRRAGSEIEVLHTVQLLERAIEPSADFGMRN